MLRSAKSPAAENLAVPQAGSGIGFSIFQLPNYPITKLLAKSQNVFTKAGSMVERRFHTKLTLHSSPAKNHLLSVYEERDAPCSPPVI